MALYMMEVISFLEPEVKKKEFTNDKYILHSALIHNVLPSLRTWRSSLINIDDNVWSALPSFHASVG